MRRKITQIGTVVSTAMEKTAVVRVDHTMLHPRYKKYIRRSKRYLVHDEHNRCKIGDKVMILQSRALSRRKRWRMSRVIEHAAGVEP